MSSRNWWVLIAACLFVVAAYQVGRRVGEHSAKIRFGEQELAFQKEKEAARKAELAKFVKMYEEEKQATERKMEKPTKG